MKRFEALVGCLLAVLCGCGAMYTFGLVFQPLAPVFTVLFVLVGTAFAFQENGRFGWLALVGLVLYVLSWVILPEGYVAETWATVTRPGLRTFRWDVMPSAFCTLLGMMLWGYAVGVERMAKAFCTAFVLPFALIFA